MATVTNSTTLSLTLEVGHDETLSQGDFVVVEGTSLIAQLSHTETAGGAYSAEATFVGEYPDQPIPEGNTVSPAPANLVRSALRLPSDGVHLGEIPTLGSEVYLDPSVLMEKQIGVFGRTGSGKSYSAAVLIEELLEHDMPVVIIDPHGEYTSLQVAPDGTPSDYPVKHFANLEWVPEADAELDLDSMDLTDCIAPGQAAIIDLHGLGDEQERVVTQFLEDAFLARKREQIPGVKIVIEEAHNFATKNKSETRSVLRNIAKEGRKFQFTLGIVSQRPSGIDHNVRAQLQSMALHKLTDDTDVAKAIDITEGIDSSWDNQIQQLKTGNCILAGDLIASPTFVDVRERRTMHQSGDDGGLFSARDHAADPKALEEHQSELAEYVEQATADQLRQHVRELTRKRGMDAEDLRELSESDQPQVSEELLEDFQEEIGQKADTIEELRSDLEKKDERIKQLQHRLDQQSKPSGGQQSDSREEKPDVDTPQQQTSGSSTSQTTTAGTTDRLLNELEDGGPEYDGEWRTQPKEARPREVVLRNEHVVRKVRSMYNELEELSKIERQTLRSFKEEGPISGEDAFEKASTPFTDADATEVIQSLREDGFIARNGRGAYDYNLDNRVENRFYDILHRKEMPFVIDAVEQKL